MKKILTAVFTLFSIWVSAQENGSIKPEDEYSFLRPEILYEDGPKLYANLYLHTFFKNNEYFGDFIKGYTLTGWHFQPEITFNVHRQLKIQAVWNVLNYNGYGSCSENKIYPRIVFKPKECFTLVCGCLEGNVRHRMTEPVYNPERYYTDNVENGLQFLLKTIRYDGDMWLNWEKFILWDDPWQEKLTFGHRSDFSVIKKERFRADITGEILISHRGGQIDSSPEEMQSLENGAAGLKLHFFGKEDKTFRQLTLQSEFVQFHAISSTPDIPYSDGFAFYNKVFLKTGCFGFTCGYWYGDRFMNFRGDRLFTSQAINPENNVRKRNMIFSGLYFYKKYFSDSFILKTGADSYFDIQKGNMEYSYMLSLIYCAGKGFLKNK